MNLIMHIADEVLQTCLAKESCNLQLQMQQVQLRLPFGELGRWLAFQKEMVLPCEEERFEELN